MNKGLMDQTAAEVNASFKRTDLVVPGTELCHSDVKFWIPTTSWGFNKISGGGIPGNRMIEIYGQFGDGKSTLLEDAFVSCQKMGGLTFLIDDESKWDRTRALRMGHDVTRHLSLKSPTLEIGLSVMEDTIRKFREKPKILEALIPELKKGNRPELITKMYVEGTIKVDEIIKDLNVQIDILTNSPFLVGYDTISSASPEAEMKPENRFSQGMGIKPRKIREAMRRLSMFPADMNCSIIFISQMMDTFDSFGPGTTSSSGGGGIKFHCTERFYIKRTGKYDIGGHPAGIISCIEAVKNQLAPPFKKVNLYINFLNGIDLKQELFMYLYESGKLDPKRFPFLTQGGGWYYINNFPEDGNKISFRGNDYYSLFEKYPGLLDWMRMNCDLIYDGLI